MAMLLFVSGWRLLAEKPQIELVTREQQAHWSVVYCAGPRYKLGFISENKCDNLLYIHVVLFMIGRVLFNH